MLDEAQPESDEHRCQEGKERRDCDGQEGDAEEEEEGRECVGQDAEEEEEGHLGAAHAQGRRLGDGEEGEEHDSASEGADLRDLRRAETGLDLGLGDAAIECEEEGRDEIHHRADRLRARRGDRDGERGEWLDGIRGAHRDRSAR